MLHHAQGHAGEEAEGAVAGAAEGQQLAHHLQCPGSPHGHGVEVLRVLALASGDDLPAGHHHLVLGGEVVEQSVLVARALDAPAVNQAADGEVVQLRHHGQRETLADLGSVDIV